MKIETEIPDINRDEIIGAMASKILLEWVREHDPEQGGTVEYPQKTELAKLLAKGVHQTIERLVTAMLREHFETTIKATVEKTVSDVLAEGWRRTDPYGHPKGEVISFKERINEIITEDTARGYGQPKRTLAQNLVVESVTKVFSEQFGKEIETARAELRRQLDAVVSGKFTETIKQALGLR